jgi:hypothetical protein
LRAQTSPTRSTPRTLALLLAIALLASAWSAASASGAADTFQSPEQLNQPGTPLATSYSRSDSNVGATGTTYFCNSINYTDDVWYQFHPQYSGFVSVQAFSNAFFATVTLWQFSSGVLGPLANGATPCNTAAAATRTAFVGAAPVQAGKTYDVQVGIQCQPNNSCATTQTGGPYTFGLTYDPDTDGDGVADSVDACRTTPGPIANNGCPPDGDRDGVPDSRDACPTRAGSPTAGGCPVLGALIGQNFASLTRVRQIYATQVAGGSTVRAICHGHSCFGERKVFVRRAKRKVVLVRNRTLGRGDVITITVTAPGTIGKYRQLRIGHRSSAPRVGDLLCMRPGARRPSRCPS